MLNSDDPNSNSRDCVRKIKIILWKSLAMRKHGIITTVIEIFLPVIIYGLLYVALIFFPNLASTYVNETKFYPRETSTLTNLPSSKIYLLFTPNIHDVKDIMGVVTTTQFSYFDQLVDFATEDEMMDYVRSLQDNDTFCTIIGVVFNNYYKGSNKLSYRILANINANPTSSAFQDSPPYVDVSAKEYVKKGFVALQKSIDFAFIDLKSNKKLSEQRVNIEFEQMPTPPHEIESVTMNSYKPFLFIISFILLFFKSLLPYMIVEKSLGVRQITYIMGLEPWQHWFGWFLYTFFPYVINITLLTILLTVNITEKLPTFFENSNLFIIWLFTFCFYVCNVIVIFFFSSIFKTFQIALSVILLWCFLPYFLSFLTPEYLPSYANILLMLIPNMTLKFGVQSLMALERIEGVHFGNLFKKPSKYSNAPSIGIVIVMFIFDAILYFLLTWYIDKLFPGDFGIPKRWNFLCKKSFWRKSSEIAEKTKVSAIEKNPIIEPVKGLNAGIMIRDLKKIYKHTYAVDGFSIDIYSKQITVLLGHNGAGKTTTIGMITGMIPSTSGTVVIDGYNIEKSMNVVQKSIGLCLQNNTEIPNLTVLDHLIYFAMLRGSSMSTAKLEALHYLEISFLKDKANTVPKNLSGGMRRKLAIGMAMVGNSKVVLLDEPTSGLDPQARRDLWDFLLATRGEKTILITTHYMEEADVLGDRIAIMHNGHLICYGTSLFLKNYYDTGYKLTVLVQSANSSEILAFIREFVSSAYVKSSKTGSIEYLLPTNNTNTLANLIKSLEENTSQLGIINFGLCITSLEDVFIKVGEIANASKGITKINQNLIQSDNELTEEFSPNCLLTFKALCYKRLHYYKHKKFSFLFSIIIPICLILFVNTMTLISKRSVQGTTFVDLKIDMYEGAESFYFYDASASNMKSIANYYKNVVRAEGAKATSTPDIYNSILDVVNVDETQYHKTLITGAQFNNGMQISAMYGHYALYGPPISLNLVTNSLLHWCTSSDAYSIKVAHSSLPISFKVEGILIAIMTPLSFVFSFTVFYNKCLLILHEENTIGFKHLQQMAGVSKLLYWFSAFVFDFIIYLFLVLIYILILLCFDYGGCIGNFNTLKHIFYLLFILGFSLFPFMYTIVLYSCVTLFSKGVSDNMVQVILQLYFAVYGFILPLVGYFMISMDNKIANTIFFLCNLRPLYAFANGFMKVCFRAMEIDLLNSNRNFFLSIGHPCIDPKSKACEELLSFYKGPNSIKENVTFLYWDILLYWCLLLLFDYGLLSYCRQLIIGAISCRICNSRKESSAELDIDVINESTRVQAQLDVFSQLRNDEANHGLDLFLVKNLHKWFISVYPVHGLYFGVKKGECFGLLGINGAGKTTTFRILTGELIHNTGNAYFNGLSLNTNRCSFFKKMGYAPQFDAFINELTVHEMLYVYGSIRGIPANKINHHIEKWLSIFDIHMYRHIQCARLSGGTKRKVSSAISLIGNPNLILLDEPTSGIDPIARRNLWDVLAVLQKSGRSIILTSQSMDECEALCDRLAIMVAGQFKCIGNIQYLKSKYGYGCTFKIKLQIETTNEYLISLKNLKEIVSSEINCILIDEIVGMLVYKVTNKDVTLSDVFILMESLKKQYQIVEDYSISSANLEEIFLSFAKNNRK